MAGPRKRCSTCCGSEHARPVIASEAKRSIAVRSSPDRKGRLRRHGLLHRIAPRNDERANSTASATRLQICAVDPRERRRRSPRPHLAAHLHAKFGVEVRKRLVKQKHLRTAHNRAPHRDALCLTAGKLARTSAEQLSDADYRSRPPRAAARSAPHQSKRRRPR